MLARHTILPVVLVCLFGCGEIDVFQLEQIQGNGDSTPPRGDIFAVEDLQTTGRNYALLFNTNDLIHTVPVYEMHPTGGTYTVEFWMKLDQSPAASTELAWPQVDLIQCDNKNQRHEHDQTNQGQLQGCK